MYDVRLGNRNDFIFSLNFKRVYLCTTENVMVVFSRESVVYDYLRIQLKTRMLSDVKFPEKRINTLQGCIIEAHKN